MRRLPQVSRIRKSESILPIPPDRQRRRNPVRCHPADAVKSGILNPIPRNRNRAGAGPIGNPHIRRRQQPTLLRPRWRRQTDGNDHQQRNGQPQGNTHHFHPAHTSQSAPAPAQSPPPGAAHPRPEQHQPSLPASAPAMP